MGEFVVKGPQALDLVQKVTSNDASKLKIGQVQYSCLPNETGGIVDDLLVYRLPEDQCAAGEQAFMLVVNASNIEKDWNWIQGHNTFDTRLINISDQTGLIALQGPKALSVLQPLTSIDLAGLKYYTFTKGTVAGIPNVLVSATGYTGAGGFELYVEAPHTAALWDALFESGAPFGIQPAGLGARDTLRLEMGYCLYGNDIDDTTSPIEAGLGWITKLDKTDFTAIQILRRQKAEGPSRKLVGLTLEDRRIPRYDVAIAWCSYWDGVCSRPLFCTRHFPFYISRRKKTCCTRSQTALHPERLITDSIKPCAAGKYMNVSEGTEKFIQSWGALATSWGINRTMAQIHALLLTSPSPLTADDIMELLQMSRGNVNLNLRALMDGVW
jgi:aminomethyltransferase